MAFEKWQDGQIKYVFSTLEELRAASSVAYREGDLALVDDHGVVVVWSSASFEESEFEGTIRPLGVDPSQPGRWQFHELVPEAFRRVMAATNLTSQVGEWGAEDKLLVSRVVKLPTELQSPQVAAALTISGYFTGGTPATATVDVRMNGVVTNSLTVHGGVDAQECYTQYTQYLDLPQGFEADVQVWARSTAPFVGWAQLLVELQSVRVSVQ